MTDVDKVAVKQLLLVYDKNCPFCENYCQLVRIRESAGELVLVDARQDSEVMKEITAAGLDIDQGMVFKVGEVLYYGADAIHALALFSSRSGLWNRFNVWLFSSQKRASWCYPVLRACRNLALKLIGVTKIYNLNRKNNG